MVSCMNEIVYNELANYCLQVKTGKPCAMTSINDRDIDCAEKYIEENELLSYTEENEFDWLIFWIYKDEEMLNIIKSVPDIPITKYDHWVLGNLFGYSHDSIMKFLEEKCD